MSVAALILAAGRSRRAAPHNKLLLRDAGGVAMVARVADAALASRARPVIVVTGHQAEAVRAALQDRALAFAHAPDHASGLSASLRAGVAALPEAACAVLVCLGDMPLVGARVLDRLIGAWEAPGAAAIQVAAFGGRRGNPVLWDARFLAELGALQGDAGARIVLERHASQVRLVETGDASVLVDFDAGGPGWTP